jgi:hypothetical protein
MRRRRRGSAAGRKSVRASVESLERASAEDDRADESEDGEALRGGAAERSALGGMEWKRETYPEVELLAEAAEEDWVPLPVAEVLGVVDEPATVDAPEEVPETVPAGVEDPAGADAVVEAAALLESVVDAAAAEVDESVDEAESVDESVDAGKDVWVSVTPTLRHSWRENASAAARSAPWHAAWRHSVSPATNDVFSHRHLLLPLQSVCGGFAKQLSAHAARGRQPVVRTEGGGRTYKGCRRGSGARAARAGRCSARRRRRRRRPREQRRRWRSAS